MATDNIRIELLNKFIYRARNYLKEANISNDEINNLFDVLYKSTYEKDTSVEYWETILETTRRLLDKMEELEEHTVSADPPFILARAELSIFESCLDGTLNTESDDESNDESE